MGRFHSRLRQDGGVNILNYTNKVIVFFCVTVNPDEIVAPPANGTDSTDQPSEMQYKDKKEAIEAFKELLKERVCYTDVINL